jgi:hypothetical protein
MNEYLEIEDIIKLSKTNINTQIDMYSNQDTIQIEKTKSKLTQINIGLFVIILIVGGILFYNYNIKKEEVNKPI